MYKAVSQIWALTKVGLSTVPKRLGISGMIVLSIGGVVLVLVSVLSMVVGLSQSMHDAHHPNRAIVLRGGAISEIGSVLSHDVLQRIGNSPEIRRDTSGHPQISADMVRLIGLERKSDGASVNALARGIQRTGFEMLPELRIVAGRNIRSGVAEMIVGKSARDQFRGLEIGDHVFAFNLLWIVVGEFETGGDLLESELLIDSDVLRGSNPYQSATVELVEPSALTRFTSYLNADPTANFDVILENDYLKRQSSGVTGLISVLAYVVSGIMAIGAVCAAVNAMYYAIDLRAKEIATLRAIGFSAGTTAIAILLEAIVLAVSGGVVGGALAWLVVGGHSVTTAVGLQLRNQLVFHLVVNWQLFLLGLVLASIIGLLGGLIPAIRASRLPVATALQGL